jgi:hypothetical protein
MLFNTLERNVSPPLAISKFEFCIYGIPMVLSVNVDYFLKQNYADYICNGEVWFSLC